MTPSEPNIDVTRLKQGTRFFLETETAVYKALVLRPKLGLLQVTATLPELQQPTVGQLIGSYQPTIAQTAGAQSADTQPSFPDRIVKGLALCLRFANGYFTTSPVTAAEVTGDHWHYIVF